MHFCSDELAVLTAGLSYTGWLWWKLRSLLRKKP